MALALPGPDKMIENFSGEVMDGKGVEWSEKLKSLFALNVWPTEMLLQCVTSHLVGADVSWFRLNREKITTILNDCF